MAGNDSLVDKKNTVKEIARNTIFAEAGGNAIWYSVNYDRILFRNKHKISLRVGASFLRDDDSESSPRYFIPVELNFMKGKKNHIEYGFGFMFNHNPSKSKTVNYYVITLKPLGYRLQKEDGGFFFKANLLILVIAAKTETFHSPNYYGYYSIRNNEQRVIPWAAIGLGYTFKRKNPATQ
jgi:hypothetical protein